MNFLKFVILCFFLFSTICQSSTVTIRADEWYPINGIPDSENPGYMIEIAQIILAEHGHTVEYRVMPWKRSVQQVREGSFDCVVGAYKEDAPDFLFPNDSWGSIGSSFYVKKGKNWRYKGMESIKSIKVGVIGGYAYSDKFDEYIKESKGSSNIQVINSNNALEQNIKKMMKGRIDAVLESHLVMEAKLKTMGLSTEVISAGELVAPEAMYIACSPARSSSKEYVRYFSEGIKSLRASGKLKQILNKYGLKDWK